MKLGILNATTPEDEDIFSLPEIKNFQAFFDTVPQALIIIEYRVTQGEYPADLYECDAYLITGSPQGVYDTAPWIVMLADFIRRSYAAGQKLVGICFGHQLLAHTLGGHAEKSVHGWGMGLRPFDIYMTPPWMNPRPTQGQLYFCHQDQVVRLPEKAQPVAGNRTCPHVIFVMDDQVLGIQGHPEFSPTYMAALIDMLAPTAGTEVVAAALASLQTGAPDTATVAHWIINFLQHTESP